MGIERRSSLLIFSVGERWVLSTDLLCWRKVGVEHRSSVLEKGGC